MAGERKGEGRGECVTSLKDFVLFTRYPSDPRPDPDPDDVSMVDLQELIDPNSGKR